MPDWIPTFRALVSTRERPQAKKWVDFPLVNDELALLWMVNMGCIDMNPWYSRVDQPDRPDFVLFDLDPTPEVPWSQTIRSRCSCARLLDGLGLVSFPKTSGGKGFHVLVPLDRRSTYDDARAFAEHRRRRDRARAPEARDDRVGEVAAARRADRREPERRGQDDRVGVLGAPAPGRAGLDAARVGRGRAGPRSRGVHDGRRCWSGRAARRPPRGDADDAAVARRRRSLGSASAASAPLG